MVGQFPSNNKCYNTKNSFKKVILTSKSKPNLTKNDRGREFYENIFQNFLKNNNLKHDSRNSSIGDVFAEKYTRTIRDLLKWPVFARGESNWLDVLPTITKFYKRRLHSLTKVTRIKDSSKKNERFVYKNLLDNRKQLKPKFQIIDLIRTADLKRTFSKGDTNNWSYKLYKITEIISDTIPSFRTDKIPERSNEAILKKSDWSRKEKDSVIYKLNLN